MDIEVVRVSSYKVFHQSSLLQNICLQPAGQWCCGGPRIVFIMLWMNPYYSEGGNAEEKTHGNYWD